MNWLRLTGLTLLVAMMVACGEKPSGQTPAESTAPVEQSTGKDINIFLRYMVEERGIEPYETTFIITRDYIRIDDDDNPRNFVLVDRKAEVVYSVSDDNDAILVIHKTPVELEPPMKITLHEERVEEENAPRISGKSTVQYVFEANDQLCYLAVVAEGLLPEASRALQEYLGILAGQHASTLHEVPADQVTACDLSMHIFHPGLHLKHGLPVREWDGKSFRRQLIDLDDKYELPAGIFELPKDFGRFTIQDLQEGAAALAAPQGQDTTDMNKK